MTEVLTVNSVHKKEMKKVINFRPVYTVRTVYTLKELLTEQINMNSIAKHLNMRIVSTVSVWRPSTHALQTIMHKLCCVA